MKKLKTLAKTVVRTMRNAVRRFDKWLRRAVLWPFRKLWRFRKLRKRILPMAKFARNHHRVTAGMFASVMLLGVAIPVWQDYLHAQRYVLSSSVQKLVGEANENITNKIEYNPKTAAYEFNASSKLPLDVEGNPIPSMVAQAGGGDADAEQQYSVDVARSLKDGVTYHENNMGLSFTLTPQFAALSGEKVEGGRLLYPLADGLGGQLIYTATHQGLKEDVVLHKKPKTDEVALSYSVNLPESLDIKLLDTGEIGVYSADPALYGSIQYGSSDDREKVEAVRNGADKTYLAFTVPAPYVVGLDEQDNQIRMPLSSRFVLSSDKKTLSVITNGFDKTEAKNYPLSIDPSVTVTSTTDFTENGNDEDGNLTYGSGEVSRTQLSGGRYASWSTTTAFPASTRDAKLIAYNNFMYGFKETGGFYELFRTSINSNGTLGGSWTKETNQPTEHNRFGESVLYNGYLYLLGGEGAPNKVEYTKINQDGTVGVWRETSALSTGRQDFGAATYNGYMYVIGNGSSYTNVVEYAAISANGSLGAWQTTSALPAAIGFNGAAASNGYLYSIGSASGGIYYAKINDNGSVGAWMATNSPATGVFMDEGETFVYRGYLYIIAGYGNGSDTSGQTKYAQINADGSIGQWVDGPALGTGGRLVHLGATAYNGYIYAAGGALTNANGTPQSTVRYAQIGTAGDVSKWTVATPAPTVRREAAVVVYDGYLYQMGGANATTTAYNTIQYAALTATGSWGSWTTNSTNLPTTMRSFTAFAYKGYMYAIGGTNGAASTYSAGVYRATISSNGSISSFSATGQTQLTTPGGRYDHATVVYNDYVYVLGGRTGASAYAGTVHYAQIDASGNIGTWTNASNTFSTARAGHTAIQYGGYLYILGGWNGTTRYSDVQYAKINSNGSLTAWSSTESLFGSEALVNHATVAANGYLYTTGGQSNSGVVSRTAKARINTDGSLATWEQVADIDSSSVNRTEHQNVYYQGYIYNLGGTNGSAVQSSVIWAKVHNGGAGGPKAAWQTTTPDFVARERLRTVAYNGYLYTIGGLSGNSDVYHNDVRYAKLNDNGSLDTWLTATPLSVGRATPGTFAYNGKLYVVGGTGSGSNYLTTSEYADINPDGSLGAWQTTTSMPAGRRNFSSVQFGEYFYILGGRDGASGTYLTSVSYVKINADGTFGTWQTATSFSGARRGAAVTAAGGYLYVLGGDNADVPYGDVQYAKINSNGSLGAWEYTSSFGSVDENLTGVAATAYNGYIYMTGGLDGGGGTTNNIMQAELSASGALGEWIQSPSYGDFNTDRFNHDIAVYNGYLYLVSGQGFDDYINVVEYTSLDVQSRSATYSKIMNLGAFSAINNISYTGSFGGGSTRVKYRTAGASGEFGASRFYNDVDGGSSVDICVAAANAAQKYVMMTVTIDDAANALFADNVANNASSLGSVTIDYEPPVRAPTELRMRSGKWFYDETLRPMDMCGPVVVSAPEEPEEKVMPQYVGWSANGTTGASSLSVPVPSNSRGYTAVIAGEFANNEATINAPAGWQLVTSIGIANAVVTSTRDKVFVYVATSETPGSNWAWTNGSAHVTIGITGYSVPVEVASSASARTTQTAPSITTSVPDALIMRMVADLSDNDASMSYPSSATLGRNQRRDFLSGFGASIVGVAYSELAAAGSTGTATFGISGSWFPVAATLALVQAD